VQTPPQSGAGLEIVSLFGSGHSPGPGTGVGSSFGIPNQAPASVFAPSVSGTASTVGTSLYGTTSGGGFVTQIQPGGPFELSNLTENSATRDYLKGKKLSPQGMFKLFESDTFRISGVKAFHDDTLILALFSSNKSGAALTDIQYTFSPVPSLSIRILPDPIHHPLSDLKTEIKNLPSLSTSVLLVRLDQTTYEFNLTCTLSASFKNMGNLQHARVNLPFSPIDFIRPLDLDLNNYGKFWQTHAREAKLTLPTSTISTPETYVGLIGGANFKVISVRGMEVVSCARTQNGKDEFLLLYAKIIPHQLVVALRTKEGKLTDAVSTDLKHLFSQK